MPSAEALQEVGTRVAIKLDMAGNTTPSPNPTAARANNTACRAQPAETTCRHRSAADVKHPPSEFEVCRC